MLLRIGLRPRVAVAACMDLCLRTKTFRDKDLELTECQLQIGFVGDLVENQGAGMDPTRHRGAIVVKIPVSFGACKMPARAS